MEHLCAVLDDFLRFFGDFCVVFGDFCVAFADLCKRYLETKRSRFPRFYLLADQQLLRMIAETRQPTDIQPHLNAIFDGIRDLRFAHAGESLQVIGLTGVEGDYIVLDQNVVIGGALENWLLAIEKAVKRAIQEQIRHGLEIFPKNAIGWDLG
jgi:dynein heavy chain, axonemal